LEFTISLIASTLANSDTEIISGLSSPAVA
jgi:hypothetical protein